MSMINNDQMEFDFFGETTVPEERKVSLDEIHKMGQELHKVREKIKELEKQVSLLSAQKEHLQENIINGLKANGLKKFPVAGVGDIIRTERMMVTMPKDPDARRKVLDAWIAEGWGDDITIHSATLNSKFNSKVEQFDLEGMAIDLDKIIPGIEAPKMRETIQVRKGKNQ
jgi:hypothetical protein